MRGFVATALSLLLYGVPLGAMLAACSSSSSSSSAPAVPDQRVVAVQKALDAKPPTMRVANGPVCDLSKTNYQTVDPKRYAHVFGASVKATGFVAMGFSHVPCYTVTWSAAIRPYIKDDSVPGPFFVVTGRYVVDKVGEEQDTALGKMTLYTAHFAPNKLGSALIAAKILPTPQNITDGQVSLRKGADGNWIAG